MAGITQNRDPKRDNATPEQLMDLIKNKEVKVGVGNTVDPFCRVPTYEVAANELKIGDEGVGKHIPAYITIGFDRPEHVFSGYGGQGGNSCATIDLCAGIASSLRKPTKSGVKSYDEENVVGKLMASDASRIYISQKTDIDSNFGLPKGKSVSSIGGAAIAVKSDHVRLIGRTSIKIYAGAGSFEGVGLEGEKNAQGGKLNSRKTIELIASDVRTLEPLVKGNSLLKCLANIYGHIAKLYQRDIENNSSIMTLRTSQIAHFHPSTPVVTFPDPIGAVMGITGLTNEITTVINNVTTCFSSELDKAEFLGFSPDLQESPLPIIEPFSPFEVQDGDHYINSIKGKQYILSSNVFTT